MSLSSDGLGNGEDEFVESSSRADGAATDAKMTEATGSQISLRQVQEALCLLCEEPDDGAYPPLWQHEDGRYSVAGGSIDPYHIATLVWGRLLGKQQAEVSLPGSF